MKFLDVSGSDLGLTLTNYALDSSTKSIVTGYNINAAYYSIFAAYIFQFTSGSNNVYLWIPITLSSAPSNNSFNSVDVVDLTSNTAPGNNLAYFTNTSSLSAFNFFDLTDYNQWYTTVIGTNTLLVSKFIYRVGTYATVTSSSTAATNLLNLNISSAQSGSYGNKLCYASTDTTQNVLHQSFSSKHIFVKVYLFGLSISSSSSTGLFTSSQIPPPLKFTTKHFKTISGQAGHCILCTTLPINNSLLVSHVSPFSSSTGAFKECLLLQSMEINTL